MHHDPNLYEVIKKLVNSRSCLKRFGVTLVIVFSVTFCDRLSVQLSIRPPNGNYIGTSLEQILI